MPASGSRHSDQSETLENDGPGASRTDLAEDRTLLANERTFAGWTRTALACVGVGLGTQALFKEVEPTWIAKGIATIFVLVGVYLIWNATRQARHSASRLDGHRIDLMPSTRFRRVAVGVTLGSLLLLVAIWGFV
ncbi:hypothetical protein BH23VER1_BH23VER1_17150 [soil metagenome]